MNSDVRDTIKPLLEHGDISQVAREVGVSYQMTYKVLTGKKNSKRILLALYKKALSNKAIQQEIDTIKNAIA